MDSIAYAELDCIFSQLNKEDLAKIPEDLKNFFRENKDKNYNCKIDLTLPLYKQNLNPETIKYLCAINYMYLSNKSEQQELCNIYEENDKKIAKQTDVYRIFEERKKKNTQKLDSLSNTNHLIVYEKNSFIKKLFNKIKSFFNH